MEEVKVQLLLLIALALGITAPTAEGCTCGVVHFQDHFCLSEIVYRAKVIGQKTVSRIYTGYTGIYEEKMIEYKIKLIKMFKGFDKVDTIQYIYTSIEESLCGIRLDAKNKVQYLLSGHLGHNGRVEVDLCNIIERWDNLLLAQKKNLKYRYQKGCECKISTCFEPHCRAMSADKCVWYPGSQQTLHGVCMKRTNGTCSWYMDKPDSHTQHNVGQNSWALQ